MTKHKHSLENKISSANRTVEKVEKNNSPILDPRDYGYYSIRNPGAFIYKNRIGLLPTVRYTEENSSLYLAWSNNGEDFFLDNKAFIGLDRDSATATEDARVSKTRKEYVITFTSFKGIQNNRNVVRVGAAKTKDFKGYYDRRIILDEKQENKNALLFKNDRYHFLVDRPFEGIKGETPGAQISKVKNLRNFKDKDTKDFLLPREGYWDNMRVGVNTPPIKIHHKDYGKSFFMLYHGAEKGTNTYRMGYIISDIKKPEKILERSKMPLVEPEFEWEKGS
ncbi:MAG TPA: hypothetical protein VJ912_01105, partial [Candidatus Nanoarchaeia archaeon]|nr:hypothetical protein [Candidatus Nanoarchaeia archaeon]